MISLLRRIVALLHPVASSGAPTRAPRLPAPVIAAAGFAVLSTLVLAVALWPLRRDSIDAQQRNLSTLSSAIADGLDQRLSSIDLTLLGLARDIAMGRLPPGELDAVAQLRDRLADQPMLERAWVLDRQGRVLLASGDGPAPPLPQRAADGTSDVAPDGPAIAPGWQIDLGSPAGAQVTLARSIPDTAVGGGAAWLVVGLPADLLRGAFVQAAPPVDARLLVRRRADGLRLAGTLRQTAPADVRAADAALDNALDRSATLTGRQTLADGSDRLVHIEALDRHPIDLVMTRDLGVSLARWRELTEISAVVMLAVTLAVAALWAGWARAERGRNRAQQALQAEQLRAAAAAAAAQEGSWDWEPDSGEVYLSPRMKELLGHPREARVDASNWDAALADGDRERLHRALRQALDTVQGLDLTLQARQADGRWHWVRLRGRAVSGHAGTAPRLAGVASDISDEQERAVQTRRLEGQLARARRLESLGTLAGGVAHDFNNLLAVLLGYAEMAGRGATPGSAQAHQLDQIQLAAQRGQAMVKRILAFSGHGSRPSGPLCVQPVIEQVLALLPVPLAPELTLHCELEPEPLWIQGDSTPLFEAVYNLCQNARQAMPGGGRLGLSVRARASSGTTWLSHGSLGPGRHVEIAVSDTGSGIAAEVMERLFEPFFTTKGRAGTGLGLAVVHGVVQDFGGVLDVGSTPGQGSRFVMLFPRIDAPGRDGCPPATRADAAAPCPPADARDGPGRGQTVMVIDDEAALVELTEDSLACAGYEPVGYTDALAACAALEAAPQRFDLVVTDEVMPALPGTELARRVRALRADLPVLLLSGYGGQQLQQRAHAAGVRQVLMKPLPARELVAAVAAALAEAPTADPADPAEPAQPVGPAGPSGPDRG